MGKATWVTLYFQHIYPGELLDAFSSILWASYNLCGIYLQSNS